MLKRDLIMIQIEELGKMIAQMVTNREGNDGADKNLELVTTVYRTLGVDQEALMTTSLEDYVQANDSTFSLEREALLGEIDRLLY